MDHRSSILVLAGIALLNASCGREAPRARTPTVVWRTLGSWSSHGSMQTEPFISDTGSLRLRWETRHEAPPGTGTFRVTVHSDVSGRPLVLAVDVRGAGQNTTYVSEDPRSFFLAVESANLDWTLAADEAVAATVRPAGQIVHPAGDALHAVSTRRTESPLKTLLIGRMFASFLLFALALAEGRHA
jgi:hypothetical protein